MEKRNRLNFWFYSRCDIVEKPLLKIKSTYCPEGEVPANFENWTLLIRQNAWLSQLAKNFNGISVPEHFRKNVATVPHFPQRIRPIGLNRMVKLPVIHKALQKFERRHEWN